MATARHTTGEVSGPAAGLRSGPAAPTAAGSATKAGSAGTASDAGRAIVQVADSFEVIEGPGVPIRRALPSRAFAFQPVDPWLMLDHAALDRATAESLGSDPGMHPHRGFEILTYLVEGAMRHVDSEGNNDMLRAGDIQRITAGRGIWHGGTLEPAPVEALQLWINLAHAQKSLPPGYQAVTAAEVPEQQIGDATVRVLVGEGSPVQLHTPAVYYDVALPPHGQTSLAVPAGFQGFVYVLKGTAALGSTLTATHATQIAVLGEGSADGDATGDILRAHAGPEGTRFVLAAGQPHREPVRFNGNHVD